MKIHVNRVPQEGVQQQATYDPATLEIDRPDIQLPEPIVVDAFITKAEEELVVKVDVRCPLRCTCARCLEPFDVPLATDAVFSYQVQPTDVVDITEDVRQEIILAYPMIPVCQPGCKGLCPLCGENLNLTACPHSQVRSSSEQAS